METKIRLVSPLERALHLKNFEPLQTLSARELTFVAQSSEERSYGRGDAVFVKGKRIGCVQVVVEGEIRADGGEYGGGVLLGPGQTIGWLTALAGAESGLQAYAEKESLTLEVDLAVLEDVLEGHFAILQAELQRLAKRIMEARKQVADGTLLAPGQGNERFLGERMGLIQRLKYMRQTGVFRRNNMDALVEIARRFTDTQVSPGSTLWQAGEPSGFVYILITGTVACHLPDGRKFLAGPGYPLGNIESQCDEPRWYQAVTETEIIALRGETAAFFDVLEDHFESATDYLASQARAVIALEQTRHVEANQEQTRAVP